MKGYKKRSKSIIQLIDKIRDEGAALDIDLPTVVFCGNQSAGKSSLIESISGIMLPRSDGTCTRCPTELRLSEGNSEEWNCSISLQFQVNSNGLPLTKPKDVEFYNGITNIEDVEMMVRRAQKAILNPDKNPSIYRDYKFNDSSLESRTKDDEIENQAILSLAKDADPQGERTIGVLTKPDTIEAGCHDTWFQVLNNRRYKLKLGYYIIKNPTKQELDEKVTFKEAREREKIFFKVNSPWNTASASAKERMGVDRLSEALSIRLTELIEESLPSMREKVNELLDIAQKELAALPPPLSQNLKMELLISTWNMSHLEEILCKYHESLEAPLNEEYLAEFNETSDSKINQAISHLASIGINTTKNMLPSLLPGLYDTKVRKVFESSAAYYRLAQLRFGDLVPMIIYRSLVQKFANSIECHLIQELGILDDDSSHVLKKLIEDPTTASKRIECDDRLKRLHEVRKSIIS
ncbi:hypothetical protein L0F63_000214 [Massospora cicadina]|nr:hypothetical protein L0F63_000214 [Massospora cicadina]